MIGVYLASVDFPLTRLVWSKVSSYSANPLTRDKETETTSILLVTSSGLTIVPSSSWCGLGGRGSHSSRAGTQRGQGLGARGCRAQGIAFGPSPAAVAGPWLPAPRPLTRSLALAPGHRAWPGPESQCCRNINHTWHREHAACGASPLAIFSCFSRENWVCAACLRMRGLWLLPAPRHLCLSGGLVAPGWV